VQQPEVKHWTALHLRSELLGARRYFHTRKVQRCSGKHFHITWLRPFCVEFGCSQAISFLPQPNNTCELFVSTCQPCDQLSPRCQLTSVPLQACKRIRRMNFLQSRLMCMKMCYELHHHHHHNTRCWDIFWKNSLHPSSRAPETMRIYTKELWRCPGG